MTTQSLARAERAALCDTALAVGEDAPTLCEGWDAKDLVVHLLVRERSLLGSPGIAVPALSGLTDWEMSRLGRRDFAGLVAQLRSPLLTPAVIPAIDKVMNSGEFFVHHEDLRRAQPGWEPRPLGGYEQAVLWKIVGGLGPRLVKPAGVPVSARRSDVGDRDATQVLADGPAPAVLTGPPAEILLFLMGRDAVRGLRFDGDPDAVAALRSGLRGV